MTVWVLMLQVTISGYPLDRVVGVFDTHRSCAQFAAYEQPKVGDFKLVCEAQAIKTYKGRKNEHR